MLDAKLGQYPIITAFAPIKLIAAGGYFAIRHLKNRKTTVDLDYLLEWEWANDEDVRDPLNEAIKEVAEELYYACDWANEQTSVFITRHSRELLTEDALKQDIVLWAGKNIIILAAPIEWVLERKLRRIYASDRGRKHDLDMSDALAILKLLKDKKGDKLAMKHYRDLDVNNFGFVVDWGTMHRVAAAYRVEYGDDVFS